MAKTLRGRPRLDISLDVIIETVRRCRKVTAAAKALGCSGAYVHQELRRAGLTLTEVLEAPTLKDLL